MQASGDAPGTGLRAADAGVAVNHEASWINGAGTSRRCLIQTWVSRGARQSVNRLTL